MIFRSLALMATLILSAACAGDSALEPSDLDAIRADSPGKGVPGGPNKDYDGDGLLNGVDNCPVLANADQADLDGDAAGDPCDGDDDADSVADAEDNCPRISNPAQGDADEDGAGDACDPVVVSARLPTGYCYDLETGTIVEIGYGPCSLPQYDFLVGGCYCEGQMLSQNRDQPVAMAHLTGRGFDAVLLADTAGAGFTLENIHVPFDSSRVILLITADQNVFKVGNPTYDPDGVTFDVAQLNALD